MSIIVITRRKLISNSRMILQLFKTLSL